MSEQIEKIDITFKDLEAHDVRVLANSSKMHAFIYEWLDHMNDAVRCCTLEGDGYNAIDALNTAFQESLTDHGIGDLFDQ